MFFEPDVNEFTSLCVYGTPEIRKKLSHLPLSLKSKNNEEVQTKEELIQAMRSCEQMKGLSVLEHGESVRDHLFDLINHLRNGDPLKYDWVLPEWIHDKSILSDLPEDETLNLYTVFHDCGKPFCLEIDSEGKRHFPNHAEISYQTFTQFFDNETAADLIRRDMEIHLLKSDGVEEFCKKPHATTLLLTGLAEIHANSKMFGGTDSTSFMIKWKSINQRGKQIIKTISQKNQKENEN
jgi:hypothetical protein